nr:MAG TPA: regulatory protein [Caudoviricetes sp.]
MGDLTKVPHVLDSREVAEMVGKTHAHLCRDIAGYVTVISTNPKMDSLDFFLKRDYVDKKGEARKRYDITKQGCEMVANKLTGKKGILPVIEQNQQPVLTIVG